MTCTETALYAVSLCLPSQPLVALTWPDCDWNGGLFGEPEEADPPRARSPISGSHLGRLLRRKRLKAIGDYFDAAALAAVGCLPGATLEPSLDVGEATLGHVLGGE